MHSGRGFCQFPYNKRSFVQEEHQENTAVVPYVDSKMHNLNKRKGLMVDECLIKGELCHEVVNEFQSRFGEICSIQELKKVHARAIKKICRTPVRDSAQQGKRLL